MNKEELNKEIDRLKVLLANYEELDCDMENLEYVARGNGFCDAKYSEDFIEGQISQIKDKIQKLENQLK